MLNKKWRDVLVQAALSGHRQAKGKLHDPRIEADCALGVLHLTLHASREEAIECKFPFDELAETYGVDLLTGRVIIELNDKYDCDFLTIARKVGIVEEEV